MATQSTVLARIIPWTEEPGGLQSMGSQESDTTLRLNHQYYVTKVKECREKKMFVLSSSLRIPDPFLLLGDPRLLINLSRN